MEPGVRAASVVEPGERLDADDLPGGERDDGLEGDVDARVGEDGTDAVACGP